MSFASRPVRTTTASEIGSCRSRTRFRSLLQRSVVSKHAQAASAETPAVRSQLRRKRDVGQPTEPLAAPASIPSPPDPPIPPPMSEHPRVLATAAATCDQVRAVSKRRRK